MKIIIKVLRVVIALLSVSTLLGYYLVTSDVPPRVEISDLHTFAGVYLMFAIITIADFIVCIRHNYRGGYFTLFFEIIFLILWILSYNALADNNRENCILLGGIITTAIQILTQLICLVRSNIKTQTNKKEL